MSFTPLNIAKRDRLYVPSYGPAQLEAYHALRIGAPGSVAMTNNQANFVLFSVAADYPISRFWWLNGATVGTDRLQVGIYDLNFNLLLTSRPSVTSGASGIQYASIASHIVAITTTDTSSLNQDTYTTSSVTMKQGIVYYIAVVNSHASSAPAISSITATGGGAPTFTSRVTTLFDSDLHRTSIWSCVPTADYTGTLDIFFGTSSGSTGFGSIVVSGHSVDTATNDGIVQTATGTGSSTTPLATLGALGSANNVIFGVAGEATNTGTAAGTNFVEIGDNGYATPATSLHTEAGYDDTTVDATMASAPWGSCAAEIKALTSFVLPRGRYWMALHASGSTDTLFTVSTANLELVRPHWFRDTGLWAGGLPAVTAPSNSTNKPAVFGFTRRSTP